jgi:predicted transcriptional regulator of viral defense system
VTTRKTNTFETDLGTYVYKSIKPELFWGYSILEHDDIGIKIADAEKTILDYLYFNSNISDVEDFESARLNPEILNKLLNKKKLDKYLNIFGNEQLEQRTKMLIQYIDSNA